MEAKLSPVYILILLSLPPKLLTALQLPRCMFDSSFLEFSVTAHYLQVDNMEKGSQARYFRACTAAVFTRFRLHTRLWVLVPADDCFSRDLRLRRAYASVTQCERCRTLQLDAMTANDKRIQVHDTCQCPALRAGTAHAMEGTAEVRGEANSHRLK